MAMEITVRYVRAVEQTRASSLVHVALRVQQVLHAKGKQCWFAGYERLTKQVGSTNLRKREIKRKITDSDKDLWKQEIGQASHLTFYAKIKDEYRMEEYLDYDIRKVRRAFPSQ